MNSLSMAFLTLLVASLLGPIASAQGPTQNRVVITLGPVKSPISRPKRITSLASLFGGMTEDLVLKGVAHVGDDEFGIFLPKKRGKAGYTLVNSGKNDEPSENKATLISADANRNGVLEDSESFYGNLPIRLGERMYRAIELSGDGTRLVLEPTDAPKRYAIPGLSAPDFSLTTTAGTPVRLEDFAGRTLVIDVWAPS